MKVHYFQHVPFEGLGSIAGWLEARAAQVSGTKFYEQVYFPSSKEINWLIVMGGPMSVNDELAYPWLPAEKRFIAEAVAREKVVLGVCLGAQLIASAMGARIYSNPEREIGWFPIERVAGVERTPLARILPARLEVFHWHGETFDLPAGALKIARSAACENQAFSVGERVLAFQFHLETTPSSAKALIENCRNEIVPGRWVQSETEILAASNRFNQINDRMAAVLDHLAEK